MLLLFTKLFISHNINFVVSFYLDMQEINQVVRLNYTRISESLQAELTFLSDLSELTDDERFRQSLNEVIYHLNNLSDAINLQRRYLKPRA